MVTLELSCSFSWGWNSQFQKNDFKGTEGCFSLFEAEGMATANVDGISEMSDMH